jgi:MinD-like ATPase involved in chromosome partitioning or flagellar assembly
MLNQQTATGGARYLLPSSINARDIAKVLREGYEVNLLQDGLYELSAALTLDCHLIDTHPGLNEETLISIGLSDVLVVLLQDFQGTAVTLEVARKLGVRHLLLVSNKALPSLDAESLRHQVQKTYNATVASVLPLSEEMVRMGSDGLFTQVHPDHLYSPRIAQRDVTGSQPA